MFPRLYGSSLSILFIVFLFPPYASPFSFLKSRLIHSSAINSKPSGLRAGDDIAKQVAPESIGLIGGASFQRMASQHNMDMMNEAQPDCFKQSIAELNLRCEKEEMNEGQRVAAAISLTMCEICTAKNQSPPLECLSYTSMSPSSSKGELADLQARCVEALSRSAQFWSSYSGYMREIPQLCFVFGQWHEIDVAKSIYRNATLEKASLLRYMHGRESSLKEVHSGLSAMAAEAHLAMERLTRASEYIDLISTRYSQKLHDLFQILPSIENTLATLEARLLDVATRHEQSLSLKMESNLRDIVKQHSTDLLKMARALDENLQQSGLSAMQHLLTASEFYNSVGTRWSHLGSAITEAEGALRSSMVLSQRVSASLDYQINKTWEHHSLLNAMSDSLPHIAALLGDLPVQLDQQLQLLNRSALAIQEGWNGHVMQPRAFLAEWFESISISALVKHLLRVNYQYLDMIITVVSQLIPLCLGFYRACARLGAICKTLALFSKRLFAAFLSFLQLRLRKHVKPVGHVQPVGIAECWIPGPIRNRNNARASAISQRDIREPQSIMKIRPSGRSIARSFGLHENPREDACNIPHVSPYSGAFHRSMSVPPSLSSRYS